MSVPVARRQLLARKGRTIAGVLGIAVALLLILGLNAIMAGMERQITAFIDRSHPDVIVAQSGVDTIHMSESTVPRGAPGAIAALPDVARVRPIALVSTTVERGDKRGSVYLVGEAQSGSTIPTVSGRAPGPGEIVIDRTLASTLGVSIGSRVRALGRSFMVSGELEKTAGMNNSVAIVPMAEMAQMLGGGMAAHPQMGGGGVVNYVLVNGRRGAAASTLAREINRSVPGVKASTRDSFARSERHVVGDMTTDIVRAMTFVGFVIGVCVAALVAYSLALAQLRDYAVLRALGLRARRTLTLVFAQTAATIVVGFVLALGIVWAIASVMSMHSAAMSWVITFGDVAKAFLIAGLLAVLAAAFPVIRVARIDPATVFRK